jgi:hypothetical protein
MLKRSKIRFDVASEADNIYMNLLVDVVDGGMFRFIKGQIFTSIFNVNISWRLQDYFPILTSDAPLFDLIKVEVFWYLGYHMRDPAYQQFDVSNVRYLLDNGI